MAQNRRVALTLRQPALPILRAGNTQNVFVRDILGNEAAMLDNRLCFVRTAENLDKEIRNILFLDQIQRGNEISGTLNVHYSDESVKNASLIPALELYGVVICWYKEPIIR